MYYLVLASLIIVTSLAKIEARLEIITYDPLWLNLSFSEPLARPNFQLLFNQIPINFTVVNESPQSKQFIIVSKLDGIVNVADFTTEKYVIMFTQPLDIANGSLSLDSFLLRAKETRNLTEYIMSPDEEKSSHYKFQNEDETLYSIARAICILIYFLAYTTNVGMHAYNFLAIYVYISTKTSLFTVLDFEMAYYFLFDRNELELKQVDELVYFFIPYICLSFALAVSLLGRLFLKKFANSWGLGNYVYSYLTYKFAIITWEIMCIPLFANTSHILYDIRFGLHPQNYVIKSIYVYFNIVVIGFYLYMAYFTTNPQIGENNHKWKQYTETSHYQLFEGFHMGIEPQSIAKRNYQFINSCIRILIMVFVSTISTQIPNIILQLAYFIYIFTIRPFRYNFFNNFYIGIQSLIITFYMYRYIVQLYVGISPQITTSTDMARILLTNIIFVCIIVLTYLVLGAYEFYQRVRVFKINMNTWRMQSKHGDHEIRRTKRSAFQKEQDERQNKSQEKAQKEAKTNKLDGPDNKNSGRQGKKGKKGKEKSSLLQSISMGIESPY